MLNGKISCNFFFQQFYLDISHDLIENIGEFSLFCLEALFDNLTISNISQITLLDENYIKEQLSFLIHQEYIYDNLKLSEKGLKTIEILKFIEQYNKIPFYIDLYISTLENKLLYSENTLKKFFSDASKGVPVNLKTWRSITIANEIINIKEKTIEFLKNVVPEKKELIENEKDSFIFNIDKGELKIVNLSFSINKLLNNVIYNKNKIHFLLPVLKIENFTKYSGDNPYLFDEFLKKYNFLNNTLYYSLLNGKETILNNTDMHENIPKISPILKEKDIYCEYYKEIVIPSELFFHLEIKNNSEIIYNPVSLKEEFFIEIFEDNFNENS